MSEEEIPNEKKRHGCLTAFLILMMVANSGSALLYLVSADEIQKNLPNMPDWSFPVLIIVCVFNIICGVALFKWKKWGFWGFIASSCFALIFNLSIGVGIASSMCGLLGVVTLFGVLQIGNENKGWAQLE